MKGSSPIQSALTVIEWLEGSLLTMARRTVQETLAKASCDASFWVKHLLGNNYAVMRDDTIVTTFTFPPEEDEA